MVKTTKTKAKTEDKFIRCTPATAKKLYKLAEKLFKGDEENLRARGVNKPSVKYAIDHVMTTYENTVGGK